MDLFFPQRLACCDLRTSESFDCQDAFGYGAFQKRLFALIVLAAASIICQTIVVTLVQGDVDHWCKRPQGFNISAAEWKNIAIPLEADGRFSQCRVYERCVPPLDLDVKEPTAKQAEPHWWHNECLVHNRENDTRDMPCDEWEYDESKADSTAVSTWNLVCQRRLLGIALVALQYAGAVVILVPSGAYADAISRRGCLLASAAALFTTTVCSFLAHQYYLYALARFLAGGIVGLNEIFSLVIPFEVTTHAHRPQQVLLWGMVGVLLAEVWEILIRRVPIFWSLKQLVFLAPTALLVPLSCTAPESPRWLVAKGRLEEAEAVMMQAAEANHFPLPDTAALTDKLREQARSWKASQTASDEELLDTRSLRRRALAMFAAYFSMTFAHYVAIFSAAPMDHDWVPYGTAVATLLACGAMHVLVSGIALVTVLNTCFVTAGVLQCLLSIAAGAGVATITNIMAALSRGVTLAVLVHCFVFVMELFPSAVRSGALCWLLASGRVGSMFASVTFVLQLTGRLDVAFAIAAMLLFASLLAIRALPRTTMVEQAKELALDTNRKTMEHMRRTLERETDHMTKSANTEVSKSRKSIASKAICSLKAASRRHGHKSSRKLGSPKSAPLSPTKARVR
ncbi:hypothetical protein HPB50_011385 [Hyalomma asiaticum]|uniref:Uncharacterized protein n=1 Tax=Hyalomma asiaticum TaxID=266040 RepID=A0ACB7T9R0_HYAAI|nr:hypothetical protein HPB50_011385 [Hyalomma asiaticum]